MRLYFSTTPLLLLPIPLFVFELIAAFQVRYTPLLDAIIFVSVTVYLLFTAFFVANFIAEAPRQHMAVIREAYVAIAIISAAIGILAYLRMLPNAEMFLRFDRAKALFKNPNVYGPFLILPAMLVLRDLFFHRKSQLLNGAIVLLLMISVFVSFLRLGAEKGAVDRDQFARQNLTPSFAPFLREACRSLCRRSRLWRCIENECNTFTSQFDRRWKPAVPAVIRGLRGSS